MTDSYFFPEPVLKTFSALAQTAYHGAAEPETGVVCRCPGAPETKQHDMRPAGWWPGVQGHGTGRPRASPDSRRSVDSGLPVCISASGGSVFAGSAPTLTTSSFPISSVTRLGPNGATGRGAPRSSDRRTADGPTPPSTVRVLPGGSAPGREKGHARVSGKVRDRTAAARGPAHGGAKQLTGRETRRSMGPGGRERGRGTETRALSGDSCPRGSGPVCYRLYSSRVRPTLSARPLPPFMTYTGPGWLHSPWTEHRCLLTRLWGLLSEGLHVLKQGSFALTYIRL